MTTLIITAIILYIIYIIVDKDTTNPFSVLRYIGRDAGRGIGASPKIIKTAAKQAKALSKESQIEMKEAGTDLHVSYRFGRKEGAKWASDLCDPIIQDAEDRIKTANEKLAKFEK